MRKLLQRFADGSLIKENTLLAVDLKLAEEEIQILHYQNQKLYRELDNFSTLLANIIADINAAGFRYDPETRKFLVLTADKESVTIQKTDSPNLKILADIRDDEEHYTIQDNSDEEERSI